MEVFKARIPATFNPSILLSSVPHLSNNDYVFDLPDEGLFFHSNDNEHKTGAMMPKPPPSLVYHQPAVDTHHRAARPSAAP